MAEFDFPRRSVTAKLRKLGVEVPKKPGAAPIFSADETEALGEFLTDNSGEHTAEEIATHFDNSRHYKWKWVNTFLNELRKDATVYDIGCGNGRNMANNNAKNLNFIGIDNCENFIKICKAKNLNVHYGNIIAIPCPSASADALICIAVFHHLESKEHRVKALLEMKRLLKPNGKILLSVWSINQPPKTRRCFNTYGNNIVLWNKFGKIYERFYYIYKLDELKQLFNLCGLTITNYDYDCGNEIFTLVKS
jgi:alkylated DNA repair protein alkB family protein 8